MLLALVVCFSQIALADSAAVQHAREFLDNNQNASSILGFVHLYAAYDGYEFLKESGVKDGSGNQTWSGFGMAVQHGPNGARVVHADSPNGSRALVLPGGGGWVENRFYYGGLQFGRRTYIQNGVIRGQFYRQVPFHGLLLSAYVPERLYPLPFYVWLSRPWAQYVTYSWGWQSTPWFSVYGAAFTPYPSYTDPSLWLTDYMIADGLNNSYQQNISDGSSVSQQASITPIPLAVKTDIQNEVKVDTALLQQEDQP
jgi:hypothetical protein